MLLSFLQRIGFTFYRSLQQLRIFQLPPIHFCFLLSYYVYKWVFDRKLLSTLELELDTPTIIDVGGGFGFTSIWLSFKYPRARIICFEPDRENAKSIKFVLQLTKRQNIYLHDYALSNFDGYAKFKHDDSNPANSQVSEDGEKLVQCVRLESFLGLNRTDFFQINLVKIDVQGHELEVLLGAKKVISRFKPIIVLEFDSMTSERKLQSVLNLLESEGYSLFDKNGNQVQNLPQEFTNFDVKCLFTKSVS